MMHESGLPDRLLDVGGRRSKQSALMVRSRSKLLTSQLLSIAACLLGCRRQCQASQACCQLQAS